MAVTIEELQKSILKLEEEKDALKKKLEGSAEKLAVEKAIDEINNALSSFRTELAELKKSPNKPAESDDDDSALGFFGN